MRREFGGSPGLADQPRVPNAHEVRLVTARIWNWIAKQINTPFVLTVEDDVIPVPSVIELLMDSMEGHVYSVAAPYKSKHHDGYVAFRYSYSLERFVSAEPPGESDDQVECVIGNGFGCALIRREAFQKSLITYQHPIPDFDRRFYAALAGADRLKRGALVDWSIECEHLER